MAAFAQRLAGAAQFLDAPGALALLAVLDRMLRCGPSRTLSLTLSARWRCSPCWTACCSAARRTPRARATLLWPHACRHVPGNSQGAPCRGPIAPALTRSCIPVMYVSWLVQH